MNEFNGPQSLEYCNSISTLRTLIKYKQALRINDSHIGQTHRQTDTHTDRHTDRQTEAEVGWQIFYNMADCKNCPHKQVLFYSV